MGSLQRDLYNRSTFAPTCSILYPKTAFDGCSIGIRNSRTCPRSFKSPRLCVKISLSARFGTEESHLPRKSTSGRRLVKARTTIFRFFSCESGTRGPTRDRGDLVKFTYLRHGPRGEIDRNILFLKELCVMASRGRDGRRGLGNVRRRQVSTPGAPPIPPPMAISRPMPAHSGRGRPACQVGVVGGSQVARWGFSIRDRRPIDDL